MKKIVCLLLVAVMALGLCSLSAKAEANDNWKVAILTGTVSQGEEEFRAAEKAVATYGAEHIVTATYPDNFMSEMETTIAQIVGLADDPKMKVIVVSEADDQTPCRSGWPSTVPALRAPCRADGHPVRSTERETAAQPACRLTRVTDRAFFRRNWLGSCRRVQGCCRSR